MGIQSYRILEIYIDSEHCDSCVDQVRADLQSITNAFCDYSATTTDDNVTIKNNKYKVLGSVICGKTPM